MARPPGPGTKERHPRLEILTLGRDLTAVSLEFTARGRDPIGAGARPGCLFPDLGWKVIATHVSTMNEASPW